ncbi:TPA: hypothetical protein ACH3X1_009474 [Trebouxia sp. C0004]
MKRADWMRPLLELLEGQARRAGQAGLSSGQKALAAHLFEIIINEGRDVTHDDMKDAILQLTVTEHYYTGVQDLVTLLCEFNDISVKAYELRWRIANPGFLPMKAAQRFMRPVKEIREGFFTMEDEESLVASSRSTASSLGPHAVSATRHFVDQYRSRAADAGLLSTTSVASRLSAPRNSMLASSRGASPRKSLQACSDLPSTAWLKSAQSEHLQGAATLSHHQQPV